MRDRLDHRGVCADAADILSKQNCTYASRFAFFRSKSCKFEKFVVPLHADLCARMEILWIIGLVIVFLLVAVGLLSVGVILRKDHSFRSQHIHQNERMKQDKIHCATSLDKEAERKAKRKIDIKKL